MNQRVELFRNKFRQSGLTFLLLLGFTITLILISVLHYNALHTTVMDFGSYVYRFFGIHSLGDWHQVLFGHSSIYLVFYSWLYFLLPISVAPQIMLAIQATALALPAYFILKNYGKITALAYVLYFPIWYGVLFDFHIDHLSVPLLLAFFIYYESGKLRQAVFCALALALVKEPFALQTAMCGVYLLLPQKGENNYSYDFSSKVKAGVGLTVFGLGYFYLSIHWLIPAFSGGEYKGLSVTAFSWLGSSVSEMVWYIVTHPLEIFKDIIGTPDKMIYLAALFGSLGFISLLGPKPLIIALPILAISLLSSSNNYYGLGHHYTIGLIIPIIIAFSRGLPKAKVIWRKVSNSGYFFHPILITGLIIAHIILSPSPIGRLFWSEKVWGYSYIAYIPTDRDAMIKQAITDFIPTDPEIVVSIQNTVNWVTLVQRRHFLLFPHGVTRGHKVPFFGKIFWPPEVGWKSITADFVVLDLKRPWFLVDKGCDWIYGQCTNSKVSSEYLKWVEKSRRIMNVVFEKDGFIILSRNKSKVGQ